MGCGGFRRKRATRVAHTHARLWFYRLSNFMPKIPDDIVRRIVDLAKIEDVVGDFVDLRKAGVNMTGLCPFHEDEHDGNFIVRPSSIPAARHGNTYRCFVCDKKGGPVQFLMEHERISFPDAIRWLGKKYNEPVDDVPLNYTPPPPRPTPPPPPDLVIPRAYVRRTMELACDKEPLFIYWFRHLPWDEEQSKRLDSTLWQYCVGGWKDGRVVFWMIDHEGVPRAAKLMKYLSDGHRDKQAHPGWIYNQEGCRQQLKPDEHTVLKPLFGSHLLAKYPQAVVNIVESEKTAIIMANYYGTAAGLWLACGGLQHLRLDAMQPLIDQKRTVWLWPDKDGRDKWQEVADKLGSDNVRLYTQFFDTCWRDDDGSKADVADIAIRMMRTGDKPRPVEKHEPVAVGDVIGKMMDVVPHPENPWLDPDEMTDPRLRLWRETLRQRYNFNKKRNNDRRTNQDRREVCDAGDEGVEDGS